MSTAGSYSIADPFAGSTATAQRVLESVLSSMRVPLEWVGEEI